MTDALDYYDNDVAPSRPVSPRLFRLQRAQLRARHREQERSRAVAATLRRQREQERAEREAAAARHQQEQERLRAQREAFEQAKAARNVVDLIVRGETPEQVLELLAAVCKVQGLDPAPFADLLGKAYRQGVVLGTARGLARDALRDPYVLDHRRA